jgi:hypothetical protein
MGDSGALLAIEMLPAALPAEAGLKVAVNVALWPAGTVVELERLERLKPEPTVLTCEIARSAVPLLAMSMDCDAVAPTLTVPKLTVVGVMEIEAAEGFVGLEIIGFPVTPMQPAVPSIAQRTITPEIEQKKGEGVRAEEGSWTRSAISS